ncbi:hypothetical protein BDV06DRAFT_200574 [Aspergillus oleicola]
MAWSIEEVVSFVTMIITLPAFVIACRALMKWYRRWRNKNLGLGFSETSHMSCRAEHCLSHPPESLDAGYAPLVTTHTPLLQSIHGSLMDDPGDLERGWVEFNHVTTSSMCHHIAPILIRELTVKRYPDPALFVSISLLVAIDEDRDGTFCVHKSLLMQKSKLKIAASPGTDRPPIPLETL